jgi:hypothetical protein
VRAGRAVAVGRSHSKFGALTATAVRVRAPRLVCGRLCGGSGRARWVKMLG